MRDSRLFKSIVPVLWLIASSAYADSLQSQAERIARSTKLGRATLGLLVTDLSTGEELAKMSADEPLIPASNLKLITTAAALSRLGKDHVLSTELRVDGATLIVKGMGDPAFLDPVVLDEVGLTVDGVLSRWIEAVKKTGRTQFDAILVDDRAFDREFVHASWPRNQLQSWYCAEVAAINFNDNCLDFYAYPTSPGKPLRVALMPEGVPITLENKATTGSGKPLGVTRYLGGNRIVATGQARKMVGPEFVTIHDPPMSFGGLLRERLRKAGVTVKDVRRPLEGEAVPGGHLLAAVETTLPTILLRTNRDSQNLFAEALLKYLGHHATGRPGSWPDGLVVVRNFLSEAVGADAGEVVLDDGSGLSRNNRVSPRMFVKVLGYMQRDPSVGAVYRDSLAQPGQRGTFRKRLDDGELTGHLYAKSGYINGTITLSGYLVVGGRTIAYSMLLNNYANGGRDAHEMMEKVLIAVDRHFATREPEPAIGG